MQASLRLLLRLWSQAKPHSYNVKGLKRVLAAEGLHHMWLWISLMTQRESLQTISSKIQATNSRTLQQNTRGYKSSKVQASPLKTYLYSQESSTTSGYTSGYTSDYFSAGESQAAGYTSCPTTPLNTRRKFDFDFQKTKTSQEEPSRASHRSNSSSRLYIERDTGGRQPLRSSSLNRIPKVEKLSAPRIVETEIWKKEIYQKVTEEFKEYKYHSKLKKSGSLPNLPHYITSVDIQVVPSRTITFPKKTSKQSQHEKEILKLCGDIITELKPTPVKIKLDLETEANESTYGKINKVSIKNPTLKAERTVETESATDKFVSVKNVQIEAEPEVAPEEVYIEIKKDQREEVPVPVTDVTDVTSVTSVTYTEKGRDLVKPGPSFSGGRFQDRISQEKPFEKYSVCDKYSADSAGEDQVETDNEPNYEEIDSDSSSGSHCSQQTYTLSDDEKDTKRKLTSDSQRPSFLKNYEENNFGHFENLVNILREAV